MKAVRCNKFGPPDQLAVEDLPSPVPGPGQVTVAIKAAGVNYPDALMVQGKHQYKPEFPFGLGSELGGIVKLLGSGVSTMSVGQRVYGADLRGSFAEEICVGAEKLQLIPEGVSFEEAAALPIAYNTSYYALVVLAGLRANETVLVMGAGGGVGIAAIQIAKALGARVIAAASTDEKLAICKANGADELINYETSDFREGLRTLTNGKGIDVVYDPVGGKYAEPALRALGWCGRYLVIGFAAGEIPNIPLNLVLLKNAAVIGVFLREACNRDKSVALQIDQGVNALLQAGKIKTCVSARYRLDQVPEALNALLKRSVTGKIVIVP